MSKYLLKWTDSRTAKKFNLDRLSQIPTDILVSTSALKRKTRTKIPQRSWCAYADIFEKDKPYANQCTCLTQFELSIKILYSLYTLMEAGWSSGLKLSWKRQFMTDVSASCVVAIIKVQWSVSQQQAHLCSRGFVWLIVVVLWVVRQPITFH